MKRPSLLAAFATVIALGTAAQDAAADGTPHTYTLRLHQLNVSRTRAKYDDTISVSFRAKINGVPGAVQTYYLGNHGSGAFWPLLPYTFTAGDNDQVEVDVSIVNDHDPNDAASKAVSALDTISDYAEKFVQAEYPLGPVWPAVNSVVHTVNGWFAGGCDGAVAADTVLGTGATLRDWTAGGVYYTGVDRHDGTNSPWYCGATSLYFTQYSITRDD